LFLTFTAENAITIRLIMKLKKCCLIIILIMATQSSYGMEQASNLFEATKNGNLALVQSIVEKNCAIDAQNNTITARTALHYAVDYGHKEIVEWLICNGATVDKTDKWRQTALHVAVESNKQEIADHLIKNNACVNARDKWKRTPLHKAAAAGYTGVVKQLLDNNAAIDAQDISGLTALHYAADNNRVEALQCLLNGGANVNIQDKKGKTALHYATKENKYLSIFRSLLWGGATSTITDKQGNTALGIDNYQEPRTQILDRYSQLAEQVERTRSLQTLIDIIQYGDCTILTSDLLFAGVIPVYNIVVLAQEYKRTKIGSMLKKYLDIVGPGSTISKTGIMQQAESSLISEDIARIIAVYYSTQS
jgi:Ankyrin repeats (3 copies)/Ankyrin repeats (many copies)